jgi:dTDP-glucose pyrophosphorylase
MNVKNAIILAAGKSTRFGENKLLKTINGKTLPEHCVEFCIENQIHDIYVTINIDDIKFEDGVFYHPIIENLKKYNYVNITFELQDENTYGTAAAILPHIKSKKLNDDFIVLFGDNYYSGKIDFSYFTEKRNCIVTYKKYDVNRKNLRFAVIKDGIIIEKPHSETSGCFFCGFVFFNYNEVKNHISDIELSGRNEFEITELCNKIGPYFIENKLKWSEITYKEDFKKIEEYINK